MFGQVVHLISVNWDVDLVVEFFVIFELGQHIVFYFNIPISIFIYS